jgi:type I restriction enzyme S subunit
MLYPAVTNEQVRSISIPLPPLPVQKRIAAKVQELIEEVERAHTACEKQLEAAKALPSAYLRQVFESDEAKKWERRRLGEVCEATMGQSPPGHTYNKDGNGFPFFQGKVDFGEVHPTPSSWCTEPKKVAEPNDILLCVRAPVGPTNICIEKCCIGRGLAAIRARDTVDPWFILYFLRFIEKEISEIGQGSTFGAIKREHISNILIPLHPLPEQRRIASELRDKMAHTEKLKAAIEKQLEAAKALPQAILRKAFSGEL